ncbi:hypothetical protein [Acinetobacter rudis]|uniref:Uncharacterized protein n=1 Tax=Acinetobacter rudis TaxID=632955 RepID=A0AAW8J6C7_9GAMM|nr:hypothetical protein [Acinetobacter rudis]MDQ8935002.1 hypothetical protein [Acinetobacter rudis]MDQ8954255.1 hypothetical protein [Acinetobacter rudis]MDQ9017443.1 hypothetical protein [Acinetobacter rudis]
MIAMPAAQGGQCIVKTKLTALKITLTSLCGLFCSWAVASTPLVELDDEQLAATRGQALLSLSYISPQDQYNFEAQRVNGDKSVGFYKLGLEADVALNANVRKLQLGCGGVNGINGCDIDIDNLSLSGLKTDANGKMLPMTSAERASSSAQLSNPFIEFAIKSPDQTSTREVVGLRLSAEKVVGLLTAGSNNTEANGINSLSGYLKINGYGNATTSDGVFGLKPGETVRSYADINLPVCSGCGSMQGYIAGYGANDSKNTGLKIPSMKAPFQINNAVVSGTRMTAANVSAIAQIPSIPINSNSGQLGVALDQKACSFVIACAQYTFIKLNTSVDNLTANINFSEGLGYIHNLPISSAMYLGLQKQQLRWPGAEEVANSGWWLSLQDPVNLGDISPRDKVDISSVYPQFAKLLGEKLAEDQYKIKIGLADGISAIFQAGISKNISPINMQGESVNIALKNLILETQNVTPNCYGGMRFC